MKKILVLLAVLTATTSGCEKEYLNPSTASAAQVLTNSDGLITVCNGIQSRFTTGGALSPLYNTVASGGLTTRELLIINQGNIEEFNVSLGAGNITNINGVVRNLWTQCQLVRANADLVLANANNAADPGTRSGIVAYASVFRALAIGTMAQYFEQLPIVTQENAPFVTRVQALQSAVAQLEAAATQLSATPVSADFTSKIIGGINLPNTLQALIARYSLMAGDYDKALAAAGRVDLTSRSYFSFDDLARNPVFEVAFGNRNVFEPTDVNLGLPAALAPEAGDRRIPFYTRANPTATQNRGTGFYTASGAPIPVYLPGEMLLIRAEAYARKSDLPNAVLELNKVRTSTAPATFLGNTTLPTAPPGAGLAPYAGPLTADAVLLDIYRNRQVELAFQGFRLEDSRRFGRPGPGTTGAERNRNFFPYPRVERENNTSTPATDPA
ncbi:RagB/SusD family nutrient uptake outer membrane protein [Hymenobacter busanensis]|uniref:RagB/SusD family nutrient uptake outer membrane protein n=1 Tax=Hymenobacter busanensis TaxID=2607656 RepID=A0A7L5A0V5_9BACT|nr:RagB/SusD family nutrient uptake outer membrane protein [Hymenobacter busanensis]KAA9338166.1 RagB/SusD family nutrient uptake outer membrane protein [Hymenobacter busanensis]QHJ09409.1 RagB/SusD family nutrient uptake outer membrane protein [Hymenobacter busanensis]